MLIYNVSTIKMWINIGGFLLTLCIVIGFMMLLTILFQRLDNVITRCKNNNITLWWFRPFTFLYSVGKYLVFYPLYFIFVSFLWKLVIVNIIWGIIQGFGTTLIQSTGIFGEYFSKTKGDYCPGIEWEDED